MRKVLIVISLLTSIISSSIFAQTVEVEWGGLNDLPKKTRFKKVIGQDSDKIFLVRTEKGKSLKNSEIWLESISKTTMGIESSYKLNIPEVYNKKSNFERLFYINNKLVLFVTVTDAIKDRDNLYAMHIDEDGVSSGEPQLVGTISSNLDENLRFKYSVTPDKKKVLVQYNVPFSTYTGEPIYFKLVDSNLEVTETKRFIFPYEKRKLSITNFQRGESGNYYIAVRAHPKKQRRTSARGGKKPVINYVYYILVYNAKKDSLQEYTMVVDKYRPTSMTFSLDEEENVLLFGFGNKRSSIAPGSVYYQKLNPRTEKFEVKSLMEFYKDRAFLAEFKQERNGDDPSHWYSFSNGRVIFLDNGSKVFITEQYYETKRIIVDPKDKSETAIYYYNYNDILLTCFDEDDQPLWYRRVPKNQFSTNDKGYYSSYAVTVDMNKIKLIYNDNPKNIKNKSISNTKQLKNNINTNPSGIAMLTTIYSDGNIDVAPMFPKSDAKYSTCPRLFVEDDGQYFVYGQKGSKYKYGNFFFE